MEKYFHYEHGITEWPQEVEEYMRNLGARFLFGIYWTYPHDTIMWLAVKDEKDYDLVMETIEKKGVKLRPWIRPTTEKIWFIDPWPYSPDHYPE